MHFVFFHNLLVISALVAVPVATFRVKNRSLQWETEKAALLECGITDLREPRWEPDRVSLEKDDHPSSNKSVQKNQTLESNWTTDAKQWPALLSAIMQQKYRSFGWLWTGDADTGSAHFQQLISAKYSYNVLVLAAGEGIMSNVLLECGKATGMKVVNTDYDYLHGGKAGILAGEGYLNQDGSSTNDQLWICGADNTQLSSNSCINDFTDANGEFDLVLMNNGMCSHGSMLVNEPMRICGGCASEDLPGFFQALTAMTKNGGTWLFTNMNSLMTIEEGRNEPPVFFQEYLSKAGYNPVFQYKEFKAERVQNGMPWTWVQTVSK